jgi:hypothetical protein
VAEYRLTRAECVKYLLMLDRMGLVELLPGDRIRPRVARDFDWSPDGPIRRYFMEHALDDFLDSDFSQAEETLEFAQALVTESALSQLRLEFRRLRARMAALHEESMAAPLTQRRGIGVVLALRRWEPKGFKRLRRNATVETARRRWCPPLGPGKVSASRSIGSSLLMAAYGRYLLADTAGGRSAAGRK